MSKVLLVKSITNIDLVKSIYGKSITRKSQMTQDAEDCDTDVKSGSDSNHNILICNNELTGRLILLARYQPSQNIYLD